MTKDGLTMPDTASLSQGESSSLEGSPKVRRGTLPDEDGVLIRVPAGNITPPTNHGSVGRQSMREREFRLRRASSFSTHTSGTSPLSPSTSATNSPGSSRRPSVSLSPSTNHTERDQRTNYASLSLGMAGSEGVDQAPPRCHSMQRRHSHTAIMSNMSDLLMYRPSDAITSEDDMMQDAAAKLESFSLFQGTNREFLQRLVQKYKPRLYKPTDPPIIKYGDVGRAMYFIYKGMVEVMSEDGETMYARLGEGKFFGEVAILFSVPRTATIVAATKCICFLLRKEDLEEVLRDFPSVAQSIRKVALERFAEYKKLHAMKHGASVPGTQLLGDGQQTGTSDGTGSIFHECEVGFVNMLALSFKAKEVPAGTVMVKGGEAGHIMYFILRGGAECVDESGKVVETLGPMDFFGEVALLKQIPQICTVRATTACEVFELPKSVLSILLPKYPEMRARIMDKAHARYSEYSIAHPNHIQPPALHAPLSWSPLPNENANAFMRHMSAPSGAGMGADGQAGLINPPAILTPGGPVSDVSDVSEGKNSLAEGREGGLSGLNAEGKEGSRDGVVGLSVGAPFSVRGFGRSGSLPRVEVCEVAEAQTQAMEGPRPTPHTVAEQIPIEPLVALPPRSFFEPIPTPPDIIINPRSRSDSQGSMGHYNFQAAPDPTPNHSVLIETDSAGVPTGLIIGAGFETLIDSSRLSLPGADGLSNFGLAQATQHENYTNHDTVVPGGLSVSGPPEIEIPEKITGNSGHAGSGSQCIAPGGITGLVSDGGGYVNGEITPVENTTVNRIKRQAMRKRSPSIAVWNSPILIDGITKAAKDGPVGTSNLAGADLTPRESPLMRRPLLVNIFAHLPVRDRCRAMGVCRTWHEVISSTDTLWQTIDFSTANKITNDTVVDAILGRYGQHAHRVVLRNCWAVTDRSLRALSLHCRQLTSISLFSCWEITSAGVSALAEGCPNLLNVDLSNCRKITDEAIVQLANRCIYIERLELSYCKNLTDASLDYILARCRRMAYLNLQRCTGISREAFVSFTRHRAYDLKTLILSDLYQIGDSSLEQIAQGCPGITSLSLAFCSGLGPTSLGALGQWCPSLQKLDLTACGQAVTDQSLATLTQSSALARSLRVLVLRNCTKITGEGLLKLDNLCSSLQLVNVANCKAITEAGVQACHNIKSVVLGPPKMQPRTGPPGLRLGPENH